MQGQQHADRAEALAVRSLLTGRGCAVWLDVFDIRIGADLKHELREGGERAVTPRARDAASLERPR